MSRTQYVLKEIYDSLLYLYSFKNIGNKKWLIEKLEELIIKLKDVSNE